MSDTTAEQFLEASRRAGLRAALVPKRDEKEPQGVNVWEDPDDRMPVTTVWWPRPSVPTDQITWGPNWDYSAHRDIPAETLVERVVESMKEGLR